MGVIPFPRSFDVPLLKSKTDPVSQREELLPRYLLSLPGNQMQDHNSNWNGCLGSSVLGARAG